MRGDETITIGVLAARTGLPVSAIRYYEAEGLVRAGRSPGGQRRFLRSDVRRLSFVAITQQLGFSLAEIRAMLVGLPDGRTPTKADWAGISQRIRGDLDHRIAMLSRLREKLDGCIGCGCLSLEACALYNPDDRAQRHGPGARYLLSESDNDPGASSEIKALR
jgi:MerR family transcriptional regulator, redox-sensitive transcriptional activator SoxR